MEKFSVKVESNVWNNIFDYDDGDGDDFLVWVLIGVKIKWNEKLNKNKLTN